MKLKLGEVQLERLLEIILDKDQAKATKGVISQIRKAREEANEAIEALNEREAEIENAYTDLKEFDRTFDSKRKELKALREEHKQAAEDLNRERRANDDILKRIEREGVELAAREKEADQKFRRAEEMVEQAERDIATAKNMEERAKAIMEDAQKRVASLREAIGA